MLQFCCTHGYADRCNRFDGVLGQRINARLLLAASCTLYVQRQRAAEEFPETPGEAVVELADTRLQQLGDTLRGIWRWTLQGKDAGLDGLPTGELELFLDVATSGRALRAT